MKKILSFTLSLILILSLTACGGGSQQQSEDPTPAFTITEGAYSCTPDELVLAIREEISNTTGYDFTPQEIPLPSEQEPYTSSKYRYAIIPKSLIIEIGMDDAGKVDEVGLNWTIAGEANDNATLIAFALIHMLMPTNADEIVQDFGTALESDTTCEEYSDGSYFFFFGHATSEFHLTIRPAKGSDEDKQEAAPEETAGEDTRGIDGMKVIPLLIVYDQEYEMPYEKKEANADAASVFAYSCTSTGVHDGITYDYSFSLDSDEEAISGSVGITAPGVVDGDFLDAAEVYFSSVSFVEYDTSDSDKLTSWISECLGTQSFENSSTTIGDVTFEMYASGSAFWMDISKAD